jgi:Leucine-rich repeat (LRR) protein
LKPGSSESEVVYETYGSDVATFPHDIPDNVTKIKVVGTSITAIDYIEPFWQLWYLDLRANKLITMPDMSNISSTLRHLELQSNRFVAMDYIPYLPILDLITIQHNNLTTFPDLTNISKLETFFATKNAFSSIDNLPFLEEFSYFDLRENAMTKIPDLSNISSSLTVLLLASNHITEVTITPMSRLRRLQLSDNKLTTFPDLTNISSTLRTLQLNINAISTVDLPMSSLEELNLSRNSLTAFPNLTNVANSLQQVYLSENNISDIPVNLLAPLTQLRIMSFGKRSGSPIKFPNVCYMGRNAILTLQLYADKVVCDKIAVYAKLATTAGKLVLSPQVGPLLCVSPTELAGRLYDNVTILEMRSHLDGK